MVEPTDYTKTAVNLTNPDEVRVALEHLHNLQSTVEMLKGELLGIPEYAYLKEHEAKIAQLTIEIKEKVDTYGSYQKVGEAYAVKYRRITNTYHAEPFVDNYIKYSPAVIEETVNVSEIKKLIKGGSLNEKELKDKGVIEENISYAYVVR